MSKKHLDELFQEKFKGFEETPDDKVWLAIKASLDRKKKKRVLPLWWQLAGVAAVFLIGLLLFNPFVNNTDSPDSNSVTDTEQINNDNQSLEDSLNTKKEDFSSPSIESVTQTDDKTNRFTKESLDNRDKPSSSNSSERLITNGSDKEAMYLSNRSNTANTELDGQKNSIENEIAENSTSDRDTNDSENRVNDTKENSMLNNEEIISKSEAIASNNKIEEAENKNIEGKKSLYDEIQDMEEEEDAIVKNSKSKWSAGPSIAPVYFDAIGNGSPVSPVFSANSKSGNVNMSYGLSVAYEINPRLSIRSGVHKVDYGYDTNDVYFTSSLSALSQNRIANINYAETAENLVVSSSNATLNLDSKSFDVSARTANRSGVMAQQLGYLEVPVELSYALVNNKFGVNVIGGVSSLFLVDNEVDLTSGNLTTQIGEANNVNELNFSANFGIGLGYQFSQKLKLNVEPVFKYQLNTFSNVDGTFNPYTIGIYSGISFKF